MRIYVIGDFGVDTYHQGTVRGISAEVPIPVVDVTTKWTLPAMAGNVAANLKSLGVDVVALPSGIHPDSVRPTPVKNRLVTDTGVQLARWDEHDHCEPYDTATLVQLMHADAVIVADYGKGSITPHVVEILRGATIPVYVDTKSDPTPWIGAATAILFPNILEYRAHAAAYGWLERVVLKLGAEGIAYVQYGKAALTRPALARSPRCVNGAGDTVIAAFALAHLAELPIPRCLEFASAAAANVVEQPALSRYTSIDAVLDRLDAEGAGAPWRSDSLGPNDFNQTTGSGADAGNCGCSVEQHGTVATYPTTRNRSGADYSAADSGADSPVIDASRIVHFTLGDGPVN